MSSRNSNFPQNLPDIPWWMIIAGFIIAGPLGIVLLVLKILRESKPDPRRWEQNSRQAQTDVRQDTHYDVRPRASSSKANSPARRKPSASARRTKGQYPYVRLNTGKCLTIAGACVTAIFGLVVCSVAADWGFGYWMEILEDSFLSLCFTGAGIGMILWGQFQARQTRKFKRYLARISSDEPLIPLRPLAESLSADMDEVCDTLQRMIDLGVFGDRAYLDLGTETLVTDSSVARPTPKAARPAPERSDEDEILRQIRDANDRIPGEEISRKIDRIEEITRHILQYLKKHPERSGELHTFLDYYLPTTLKMLNTYAELDAQQLDGENIAATKRRIEGILDKVVEGFELQLDKLFEGEMLDISSDIDVMEKMLQRDGLDSEMKMPRASAAPQASPASPGLTLTPEPSGSAAAAAPADEEKAGPRRYDDLGVW